MLQERGPMNKEARIGKTDRIAKLQQGLAEVGIDVALVLYSRDVLYYTGTAQPSVLLVTPEIFHLFVNSGYDFAVRDTWLERDKISFERQLEKITSKLRRWTRKKGSVGIELDTTPADRYLKWQQLLSEFRIVDVSPLILKQRRVKDEEEIACIRQACRIMDSGHRKAIEVLKEGITELELSAAVEYAHRQAGHEGIFFFRRPDFFMSRGPIGSGANLLKVSGVVYTISGVGLSAAVPVGPSLKRIQNGEPIIVDLPTVYHGYHCDQTRTYVLGKGSDGIRAIYYGLKDISDYVIANISPGKKCSEIFHLAWERAEELKLENYFMSFGETQNTTFIGHGIGLECNEPPMLSRHDHSVIERGFALALDMHMLHPEEGVVKLEDTILVTDTGAEILSVSPRELVEI